MYWVRRLHWPGAPAGAPPVQRHNFRMVQLEGLGVALANAAAPFLPVFLARLGATNVEVGLLSAMPAFTGLLLSVAVGGWLLSRGSLAAWYSRSRFFSILPYGLTGLVTLLLPTHYAVPAVLVIWALATLPVVVVNITFSVVMNTVAGPKGRYDLLGRRWSMMGLVTAVGIALTGWGLDRLHFPFNFQIAFMALSVGGLISAYFANRLRLPDVTPPAGPRHSVLDQWRAFGGLLRDHPAFNGIVTRRFLYMAGVTLAVPIVPLYYVRVAGASDAAIGLITTAQTLTLLIGYQVWTRLSARRGARLVLLATTLGLAIYPALVAATRQVPVIALLAALAGVFQGGFDLVFFDELMKRVPADQAPLFVSFDQSMQNLAAMVAPILGTLVANWLGLGGALLVSGAVRLLAFGLFVRSALRAEPAAEAV